MVEMNTVNLQRTQGPQNQNSTEQARQQLFTALRRNGFENVGNLNTLMRNPNNQNTTPFLAVPYNGGALIIARDPNGRHDAPGTYRAFTLDNNGNATQLQNLNLEVLRGIGSSGGINIVFNDAGRRQELLIPGKPMGRQPDNPPKLNGNDSTPILGRHLD